MSVDLAFHYIVRPLLHVAVLTFAAGVLRMISKAPNNRGFTWALGVGGILGLLVAAVSTPINFEEIAGDRANLVVLVLGVILLAVTVGSLKVFGVRHPRRAAQPLGPTSGNSDIAAAELEALKSRVRGWNPDS